MKIVFLSTGGGLRPEFISDLRTKLELRETDVVCLASWQLARVPLPVERHLVLGPRFRVAGDPTKDQPVQPRPGLIAPAVERETAPRLETPAAGETSAAPAETPAAAAPTPAAARATNSAAPLSAYHPRRMKAAVAWRLRRLKKAARLRQSTRLRQTVRLKESARLRQALSGLNRARRHPQVRTVRGRLTPGVSLGFAAACLRAGKVHAMARDADLVVALDAASHRGAWTLAQRVPGPGVVIGVPAAKRFLEQHGTAAPAES